VNQRWALQERISWRKLERWVGREVEILIEGRTRRGQLTGHTRGHATVVCNGPDSRIGQLLMVRAERATTTTLVGELLT